MEWTEVILLQLIDAYRNQSILWDPLHKNHYKKPLKADAWRKISADMNLSVDQCQKKITSLLSSYRREKCKLKKSLGTGKGNDGSYVSRWFAYEAFKFLEDRDATRKTETEEILGVDDMETEVDISKVLLQQWTPESPSTPRPTKRIKRADSDDSMMSSALDLLKNAAEKFDKEPSVKPTEIDAFFTYVATKVNKYSPETQKSVQHAVFDILIKADTGCFDKNAPNVF